MEEVQEKIILNQDLFPERKRFVFQSTYGEILDLALALKEEGHEVLMHIHDREFSRVGDGMIDKVQDWYKYLGQNFVFVFDGCDRGGRQDWLREQGEMVVGGTKAGDEMENDRQKNQAWFREAGFDQPKSKNFKDIDDAIRFVKINRDKKWILKQNGEAPKSINYKGKLDGGEDMVYHLEELKKKWNMSEFGEVNFDLMEIVEGIEVAASAFWNGHDYLRNAEGKVVGFLNFEEKKQLDGGLGETCGETGTTFFGCTEDNEIFKDILLRPEITKKLEEIGFHGVFDINGTLKDGKFTAFEPTMRFGVPASSYELLEGLVTPLGDVLEALATGDDIEVEIEEGWGQVIVVYAKPFPIEKDVPAGKTSQGEKLWILKGGKPIKDFTADQRKHIHLANFEKKEDYLVATRDGYLLTVTGRDGWDIEEVRENLLKYVKDNLFISGMGHRTDLGERVEEFEDMFNS